ncbi:fibronectin type 3 and ankyrin repeat domains protein 1-like [Haliotis asinina]|uniref:fibronectin type 3 and ankyrin repeat domains protein 1-like n=1 Tax=Haliotis asinina TaxID=109174 RepID=UPI00353194ED
MPNTPNLVVDNETSNSRFSRLKKDMRRFAGACLSRVSTGSVIFTFYHGSTEDALEMISRHEEVRAMILECLREIDSTVKDIQMEVQLQDFIGIRMSMWEKRPGSPQPSESSGIFLATDTMTDVGDEDDTELSEPGGGHKQTGDASKQQHTSGTVTDLERQFADMRQELKATTERMHRLEIPHQKATPPSTRRDARADADLHYVCREGNLGEVKRILDTGRADVNSGGGGGRTPVMAAAWWGHRDVVKLLVSEGGDVSLLDDDGHNILHWACMGGDRKTVEFVLSLDGVDVNSRDVVGWTPVMSAAGGGHRDVVELLVSRGADVSLVDGGGNNILHYACGRGDRKTVKFVLSLDGVDVNARNNDGQTAADVARGREHRQLSDLLVSRGAQ